MAWSNEHNPLLPDSTPVYNDSIFKFWNWFDSVWGCNDWVTWHKANVAKYGLPKANTKFMQHWENLATASSAIDCRSFNTSFRDYMKRAGLLSSLYSGVGFIAKPIGVISDVGSNVGDTLSNTSKLLKVLVPIALILVVIYFILKYSKELKTK